MTLNKVYCDSNGEHEEAVKDRGPNDDGIESCDREDDEGGESGDEGESEGEEPGSWSQLKQQQAQPGHTTEGEDSLELYLDLCEAFYLSYALGDNFFPWRLRMVVSPHLCPIYFCKE